MHAAGRLHYLVPGLPASEVATRVNRNLKNVFMERVDVSRLQRAEHIDNCRKRPRSASNIVCPCGFFCCLLKGAMTGWGRNRLPAQLAEASQLLRCVCLCCCISSSLVSADRRLPQLWEHKLASETRLTPEELQQWHLLSLWPQTSHCEAIARLRGAPGSDGFLPAITEANGCWGSKGHFNLPDSKFWVSSRNTVSWK